MAQRTVTTLHGRLDLKDLPGVYRRWPQFPLVSISDDQRRPLPFANWLGTVAPRHRPATSIAFQRRPRGGYLAFLGRISPEKRPDRAIAIAKRAGLPLKIAAKVDAADRAYFEDADRARCSTHPLVEFIGEIGDAEKSAFLGNAARPAVPDRLAGAVRPGDDRGHGLRHAGRSPGAAARCPRWSSTA